MPGRFKGFSEDARNPEMKLTMVVDRGQTVRKATYVVRCGNVLRREGTVTFDPPYELDGPFTFETQFGSITGRFEDQGQIVTGSWEEGSCSGSWDGVLVEGAEGVPNVSLPGNDGADQDTGATGVSVQAAFYGVVSDKVAATEDAVWVTGVTDQTAAAGTRVTRIDPANNEVVATIDLEQTSSDVALTANDVWIATDDGLVGIDFATNEARDAIETELSVQRLAASDEALWVTGYTGGEVGGDPSQAVMRRIEPATGKVQATIKLGSEERTEVQDVAAGADALWLLVIPDTEASTTDTELWKLDPVTDEVISRIELPDTSIVDNYHEVAAADESVWVTDKGEGAVIRIDPGANEVAGTVDVGGLPDVVAASDDQVWVFDRETASLIDPVDEINVGSVDVGEYPKEAAISGGSVWVTKSQYTVMRLGSREVAP